MRNKRKKGMIDLLAVSGVSVLIFSGKIFATESLPFPTEAPEDIISIAFPVIEEGEVNPFDFILDPQGLVYKTDAIRYGGGSIEEGATLLFHNKEGVYDFSKNSDWMTVTNYSTVPVVVTVSAQIHDIGNIELAESAEFSYDKGGSLYLALVDSMGNVQPVSTEGEVSVTFEMQPIPENPEEPGCGQYSFGLTGECNPNADWNNLDVHPIVTVVWHVEPVLTGTEVVPEEEVGDIQDESRESQESEAESENVTIPETEEINPGSVVEGEDISTEEEASESESIVENEDEESSEEISESESIDVEKEETAMPDEPMEDEDVKTEDEDITGQNVGIEESDKAENGDMAALDEEKDD